MASVGNSANSDDQLTQLGSKIREARQAAGLTLKELASRVHLTASHISQIERGVTNPSVSTLLGIAGALDLHMEYFFSTRATEEIAVQSVAGAHEEMTRRRLAASSASNGRWNGLNGSERGRESVELSPVVTPQNREIIKIVGGIEWHRLTPTNEQTVEFMELHYPVAASSGPLAYTHRGREYNCVLEGTLLVELGFAKYTLTAGSAITFDCRIPHRFVNIGDEPFVGICFILDT